MSRARFIRHLSSAVLPELPSNYIA